MTCGTCGFDPCTCPKVVPTTPAVQWLTIPCQNNHGVTIRYPVGVGYTDVQPCQWCRTNKGLNPAIQVRSDKGPLLSSDEFGPTLFEAIKTNRARLWCLTHYEPEKAKDLEAKLHALLPKLTSPDDVRRILAMT